MEQKRPKLTGRDLHAGDIVRFNGELRTIGTIGRTDAFDERTMSLIHLEDAEPVMLADVAAMQSLGAKSDGSSVNIKGDGVSVRYTILDDGSVHANINYSGGQRSEHFDAKRAMLHNLQQMVWKCGRGELKLRVPKPKKEKK
ncbi:MAG: hypothetical protein IJ640_10225 [Prevotella sp.]|nr:hypothetical protein [Prevotella sp.]